MASIGIGLASLLGAGIAGGSALGAGAIQSNAANNAAQLQAQEAANALGFQEKQWGTTQAELQPWLNTGQQGLSALEQGLGLGPGGTGTGSLNTPFTETFQAPNLQQAETYPGYQFQLQQGENAIQNSAAARGGLVSGNAATALNNYAQGTAQSDYTNVYNQAMNEYLNRFNIHNVNQANQYNRLASLAGVGQQAATTLGNQGQAAANNVGNISLTAGGQIGQQLNNAGAATASGYVGLGNALGGGLSNYATAPYLQSILASLGGTQAQNQNPLSNVDLGGFANLAAG